MTMHDDHEISKLTERKNRLMDDIAKLENELSEMRFNLKKTTRKLNELKGSQNESE